jgi:hypothetical protein
MIYEVELSTEGHMIAFSLGQQRFRQVARLNFERPRGWRVTLIELETICQTCGRSERPASLAANLGRRWTRGGPDDRITDHRYGQCTDSNEQRDHRPLLARRRLASCVPIGTFERRQFRQVSPKRRLGWNFDLPAVGRTGIQPHLDAWVAC